MSLLLPVVGCDFNHQTGDGLLVAGKRRGALSVVVGDTVIASDGDEGCIARVQAIQGELLYLEWHPPTGTATIWKAVGSNPVSQRPPRSR